LSREFFRLNIVVINAGSTEGEAWWIRQAKSASSVLLSVQFSTLMEISRAANSRPTFKAYSRSHGILTRRQKFNGELFHAQVDES
jgi:hypothetical protein